MIVLAVVAAAVAAPQDQQEVNIISQSFEQDEQGNYQYAYELDNGQKVGVLLHYVTGDTVSQISNHRIFMKMLDTGCGVVVIPRSVSFLAKGNIIY